MSQSSPTTTQANPNTTCTTLPCTALAWLLASAGRSHKRMLSALLELADDDGVVHQTDSQPIYQYAALTVEQSPNYANRIINELIWYGLVRSEKRQAMLPNGSRKLVENLKVLGARHYRHPTIQAVLSADPVSGKSMRALDPDWTNRIAQLG